MRDRLHVAFASVAIATTLASCAPNAPRLGHPTRVVSYCGSKKARMTGVDSVMTSTNDVLLDDRPTALDVSNAMHGGDGVIAYYHDQLLALPKVAAELGETDGYARVREVAISLAPEGALTRHIYLRVRDHGSERWIVMTAFDVQNVCVEGKRQE